MKTPLYLPWKAHDDGYVTCSAKLDLLADVARFARPEYAARAVVAVNTFDAFLDVAAKLHDADKALSELMGEATGKGVVQNWERVNRVALALDELKNLAKLAAGSK